MKIPTFEQVQIKVREKEKLSTLEAFIWEWTPDDHEKTFLLDLEELLLETQIEAIKSLPS